MTNELLTARIEAVRELVNLPVKVISVLAVHDNGAHEAHVVVDALVPAAQAFIDSKRARLKRVITGEPEPTPEPAVEVEVARELTPGEKVAAQLRAAADWCEQHNVAPSGVYAYHDTCEVNISEADIRRVYGGTSATVLWGSVRVQVNSLTIKAVAPKGTADGPYTIPAVEADA